MASWKFWQKKRKEDMEFEEEQVREEEKRRRKQQEEIRNKVNGERDYTENPITEEEIREFAEQPSDNNEESASYWEEKQREFDATEEGQRLKREWDAKGGYKESSKSESPEYEWEPGIAPEGPSGPSKSTREVQRREEAENEARVVASRYGDSSFEKWLDAKPRNPSEIKARTERIKRLGSAYERERTAKSEYAVEQTKRYKTKREREEVGVRMAKGKEVSHVVKGIATLGGPIPYRNARSPLYNPRAPQGTYSSGMRSMTAVGGTRTNADLVTPRLGGLQRSSALPIAPRPLPAAPGPLTQMSQNGSLGNAMSRLGMALMPANRRLAQAPQIAYGHLKSNGGADTIDNTLKKLIDAGFTDKEARSAIKTLQRKRLTRKVKEMGQQYGGDTVLEVRQ